MRILASISLSLLAVTALAADPRMPEQIVRETADALAAQISGRQDQLAADPPALYKLVDQVFLPVFDTDYAGRLVMGKYWRTATPTQRKQ
ncbi:MAG: ABC transporter substrate-binding protein, partial [Gammaproteobacteria bacterium]